MSSAHSYNDTEKFNSSYRLGSSTNVSPNSILWNGLHANVDFDLSSDNYSNFPTVMSVENELVDSLFSVCASFLICAWRWRF